MSQRKRAKVDRCPVDDDMASNGHYGSILQSIALEKEHDREALILAKRAEIQARRLAKKVYFIHLPDTMLRVKKYRDIRYVTLRRYVVTSPLAVLRVP